jgi:hypothetical protein
MFHLYLVTDAEGSWPLLCDRPLADPLAPTGTAVVALLGRFDRRETASAALVLAREAICTRDRRDDDPGDEALRWRSPGPAPPEGPAPRRSRRRSGRRVLPH